MLLYGKAVSPGVAVGRACVCRPFRLPSGRSPAPGTEAAELEAYARAAAAAEAELCALADRLRARQPQQAEILDAHRAILQDGEIRALICEEIRSGHLSAAWAVQTVYTQFIEELESVDDAVIRERAADLKDVRDRLTRCCAGLPARDFGALPAGTVLVAEDVLPSEMVLLDREKVLAIAAEKGNETSHTAILARSFGIPAVLGIPDLLAHAVEGAETAVDATRGEVLFAPSAAQRQVYDRRRAAYAAQCARQAAYRDRPGRTADGQPVQIHLNISGCDGGELAAAPSADGVGLFRTEFLYLDAAAAPDEEAQFHVYRRVLEAFAGKPVIIRTLDIGGDKKVPYLDLPREDNPFLGVRGLRLCLTRPALFHTQLRALLRASAYGELWIMFPMVTGLEEFRAAKAQLAACRDALAAQGVPVSDTVRVGMMIEVPSIALAAQAAAREADFASIGTNDLCQYVTAADRLDPGVADCYQMLHPGLLRLIADTAAAFRAAGKPLSVCGEMAGNPTMAALLVGLGVRKLSMHAGAVAGVKERLARFPADRLAEAAAHCLTLDCAADVRTYCARALQP